MEGLARPPFAQDQSAGRRRLLRCALQRAAQGFSRRSLKSASLPGLVLPWHRLPSGPASGRTGTLPLPHSVSAAASARGALLSAGRGETAFLGRDLGRDSGVSLQPAVIDGSISPPGDPRARARPLRPRLPRGWEEKPKTFPRSRVHGNEAAPAPPPPAGPAPPEGGPPGSHRVAVAEGRGGGSPRPRFSRLTAPLGRAPKAAAPGQERLPLRAQSGRPDSARPGTCEEEAPFPPAENEEGAAFPIGSLHSLKPKSAGPGG